MRLIFAISLITLFSCTNSDKSAATTIAHTIVTDTVPKPAFSEIDFMAEDKPCKAWVANEYKNFAGKKAFPLSLFVTLNTTEKVVDGKLSAKDTETFDTIEKEILTQLGTITSCYIGKTTMPGYRDLIFYIREADQKKVSTLIAVVKKNHPQLNRYTFESDPAWEAVSEFYQK